MLSMRHLSLTAVVLSTASLCSCPSARAADIRFFPDDTELAFTVNLKQVLHSELVKADKDAGGHIKALLNRFAGEHPALQRLKEAGFDVSYAYKPLHHDLGHAFLNTLLFLDYDRKGFPYPVVPFQVNCYGRRVVAQQAGARGLSEFPSEAELDPPSPAPWRCFDLGAACARVVAESPWRVALIASSSWSHAFLTPKHYLLYPDVDADRALYDALQAADYATWRQRPLSAIEDSGQQEMLNWMCLVGAMNELGRRPTETAYVQSYIFNSNKCFAVFEP